MRPFSYIFLLLLFPLGLLAQTQCDISIPQGNIHVESYGEGLPMLIINGGPGMNSQGFRSLANTFGKKYRAIIYDQRGTGQSSLNTIDSTTITLDAMVEDIEVIRAHFGYKQWIVFGQSFGGMLGSYYAAKYPERVQALILSSSGGYNLDLFNNLEITSKLNPLELDSMNYWTNTINQGDTTYYARYQRGKFLAPAYVYDRKHIPTIAHRLTQGNWIINGLVFQDMRRIQFDCAPQLKHFHKPVLILHGDDDIIHLNIPKKSHHLFPNSTLKILHKSRHYGWLDQRTSYFETIDVFLTSNTHK